MSTNRRPSSPSRRLGTALALGVGRVVKTATSSITSNGSGSASGSGSGSGSGSHSVSNHSSTRRGGKRLNKTSPPSSSPGVEGGAFDNEDLGSSKGTETTMMESTNSSSWWSVGSLGGGLRKQESGSADEFSREARHHSRQHDDTTLNPERQQQQQQKKSAQWSTRRPSSLRSIKYLDEECISPQEEMKRRPSATAATAIGIAKSVAKTGGVNDHDYGDEAFTVKSHISNSVRNNIEGGIREHGVQGRSRTSRSRSRSHSRSNSPSKSRRSSTGNATTPTSSSAKSSKHRDRSRSNSSRSSSKGIRREPLGGSCPDLPSLNLHPNDVISFLKQYEAGPTAASATELEGTATNEKQSMTSSPTSVQGFPNEKSPSSSASPSSGKSKKKKNKMVVERSKIQSWIKQTSGPVWEYGTNPDNKSDETDGAVAEPPGRRNDDLMPPLSDHTIGTFGTEKTDAAVYGSRRTAQESQSLHARKTANRSSASETRRTKTHQKIQKFDSAAAPGNDQTVSRKGSSDQRSRSRSRPRRKGEAKDRQSSRSPSTRRRSSSAPKRRPRAESPSNTSDRRRQRSPSERSRNTKPSSFSMKRNPKEETRKRSPSLDRGRRTPVFNPLFFSSTTHHRRLNSTRRNLTWTREKEDNFSDWVILVVSGWNDSDMAQTYHVHRSVVGLGSRASQKLADDFEDYAINPSSSRNVTVLNLKPDAADLFDILLDYMYGQPLVISTPTAAALRSLSDIMGVDTMFGEVNEFIRHDMVGKTTAEMYLRDAKVFEDTYLMEAAQRILRG